MNDIFSNKKLGLHKYWQKRANEITVEVMQDYKKAQDEGWIRKDLKIEFIFYFSNKMSDFLSDPKLLAMYDSMQDLIMEVANLFFYGIFPQKNENNNTINHHLSPFHFEDKFPGKTASFARKCYRYRLAAISRCFPQRKHVPFQLLGISLLQSRPASQPFAGSNTNQL